MPPRKSISSIPPLPKEGFVRLPQVLAVIPVSKTQFWEGIKTGKYPSPIKLGPRTTAWRVEDIRGLIERLTKQEGNIQPAFNPVFRHLLHSQWKHL